MLLLWAPTTNDLVLISAICLFPGGTIGSDRYTLLPSLVGNGSGV